MSAFPGRYVLSIGLALFMSGCVGSGSSPQVSLPDRLGSRSLERRDSWMLAQAKSQTLLYVSAGPNEVFVYAFPRPRLVGELRFNAEVAGLCSDNEGHVWVPLFDRATSQGKILEYEHGVKRRIASLRDDGSPLGCAVDSVTGNLAVSNSCSDYQMSSCVSESGDVVVYSGAAGSGTPYVDPSVTEYGFCAYDDSGDLFLDGEGPLPSFNLAELPRGQDTFVDFAIEQDLTAPAGIQWHGKHLAMASGSTIYEYSVRRGKATEVGTVPLNDTSGAVQFALRGGTAVVPGVQSNNVAFYHYPRGGSPTTTILLFQAISAVLSPPPPPQR